MRRRGKIGLAILALALAGGGAYVGMERPRPPLVIRVAAQQEEAVQAAAQEEAPRILIYHTHTYEAYEITETETYTPTEKWRTRDEQYNMVAVGDALARELTKVHEEVRRTTLAGAAAHYAENPPRGEFVLIVEGAPPKKTEPPDFREAVELTLELAAQGASLSEAAKDAARRTGYKKGELYKAALKE